MGVVACGSRTIQPAKVLVLTRYGRMGGSSRIRFLQFIDELRESGDGGIQFDVFPLLEDRYITQLYSAGTRNPAYLLRQYSARIRTLMSARKYDLVWIEKELFPGLPALAERLMSVLGVKMLIDYDDATYAHYENSSSWLIRTFLSRKIDVVMKSAQTVVAGNDALAARARAAGAAKVVLMPSATPVRKYMLVPQCASTEQFTIGWIGSPSTADYLDLYASALSELSAEGGTFLSIGAPDFVLPSVRQETHLWSEETEASLLARCHVAIAPLRDGDWERGKCGFKILQSMAAGLPVIASPVGVAARIITHGENGFLADSAGECLQIARRLRIDPRERARVGMAGRSMVERSYSSDVMFEQVRNLLLAEIATAVPRPIVQDSPVR
jgi:glycosyltransferase involved in cell wall biosynthesis